jgi:Tfp pilus assembly PilM family ATPase
MLQSLIKPNFPRAAAGIRRESVSVVSLQKQGRQFGLRRAATVELPSGVLQPDFFEENIVVPSEVLRALQEAAQSAGLAGQKKWSVSLPADAAQIAILTVETAPKTKAERAEVLNWKAGRAFGAKPEEMRLTFQPLAADANRRIRYFAVAIKLDVLAEYEDLFNELGWQVGLVLPRQISESNWLKTARNTVKQSDALMVSSQVDGFTAILLRQSQPVIVRSVVCTEEEREDEFYRLLLFYRDRFNAENIGAEINLKDILLIGDDFKAARVQEIATETLGYNLRILGWDEVGLDLPPEIQFEDVAAPAALASLAWQ